MVLLRPVYQQRSCCTNFGELSFLLMHVCFDFQYSHAKLGLKRPKKKKKNLVVEIRDEMLAFSTCHNFENYTLFRTQPSLFACKLGTSKVM